MFARRKIYACEEYVLLLVGQELGQEQALEQGLEQGLAPVGGMAASMFITCIQYAAW